MPSDLSVARVTAPPAQAAPGSAGSDQPPTAERRVRAEVPAATATPFPNPTLRLDPALSMVVIEFRDDSGGVRTSIPTAQQLAAYRSWDRSRVGDPPRGMPGAGEAAPEPPLPAPAAAASDATASAASAPTVAAPVPPAVAPDTVPAGAAGTAG